MKISMMKSLALCGLCAVFAGVGSVASAQGMDHHAPGMMAPGHHMMMHHMMTHHPRKAIMKAKMAYGRAMAHGNTAAAHRAHMHAMMARHYMHSHHMMHHDMSGMHHDMHNMH
jgi:hypothetical protein